VAAGETGASSVAKTHEASKEPPMTSFRCALLVLSVFLGSGIARAQQPAAAPAPYPALQGFTYWPSGAVRGSLEKLGALSVERGTPAGVERYGEAGNLKFFVERRQTGEFAPEAHGTLDDLILVLEGHARLLYGGTIEGGRSQDDGEIRGGKIVGGSTQVLSAGDLFFVPAGMPHHMMVPPGEHFDIMVVKSVSTKAALK
jgi:hypothetical protein